MTDKSTDAPTEIGKATPAKEPEKPAAIKPNETGGPKGLEPTRYGDWEKGGRCIDF
mgnify:CR=1 FL=1